MSAGAFAKIAQASATGGGNNIRDGYYKFLIEKVTIQAGHTGESFIAEFRVIEAASSGQVDERGHAIQPNAVNSTCSMVCNLTKHASAAGNAKAFVVGALAGLGYTEDQITPEVMGYITSEKNPLRGLAVIDETYRGVNKGRDNPANAGKPLTLNKWKAIAQTLDDVAAQKAYLDTNAAKADVQTTPAPAAPATGGNLTQFTPPTPAAPAAPQAPAAPAPAPKLGGILGGMLGNK
jgi:hypothetical protein